MTKNQRERKKKGKKREEDGCWEVGERVGEGTEKGVGGGGGVVAVVVVVVV